jgi:UDP-N-acetylmuramoyl-L-alanyl-D-glutamate--2,6-diaminopimelate ligase
MGAIAAKLADAVIVTDDNPRGEDPAEIAAAIVSGMGPDVRAEIIHDRGAAIASALARSRGGDTVLVAGKGHEDTQLVGTTRRPFSDVQVARAALHERSAA